MINARVVVPVLVVLCISLVIIITAGAGSSDLKIRRSVLASGGGMVVNGEVQLIGTFGQAITGVSSSESTVLHGGYLGGGAHSGYRVLLPLVFESGSSD